MLLIPPKVLAPSDSLKQDPLAASLEHEVLAEKAATYSRLVTKLEKALGALREFEAVSLRLAASSPASRSGSPPPAAPAETGPQDRAAASAKKYECLLARAGEALWYVMVQRDLCGFRRHDLFYRELKVPAAVRLRMGMVRSR